SGQVLRLDHMGGEVESLLRPFPPGYNPADWAILSAAQGLACSGDGRWLAFSNRMSVDGALGELCHLPTRQWWALPPLSVVAGVRALRFPPDGRTLAGLGYDGVLYSWDLNTQRPGPWLRLWWGGAGGLQGAFSPGGHTLAVAGEEGLVQVYPDWARLL